MNLIIQQRAILFDDSVIFKFLYLSAYLRIYLFQCRKETIFTFLGNEVIFILGPFSYRTGKSDGKLLNICQIRIIHDIYFRIRVFR